MNKSTKAAITATAMGAASGLAGAVGLPWWLHAIAVAVAGAIASFAHPEGK